MENKDELKSLKRQLRRKKQKELIDYKWIIKIIVITFFMSIVFSGLSEVVIPRVNLIIGIIILVLFIFLGILFDMIGVSVTASDIVPFNSMNSRKVKGADVAILFKKNADKVSSFCNDVIGDICGIISGSASSIISLSVANILKFNFTVVALITTAIIASLTIGGKAIAKSFAINKSNEILYEFSKFISYFYKIKK